MLTGRTLSLSQVWLHDAIHQSLNHCFLTACVWLRILTRGGAGFLRYNVRRRQSRDN
jgi:hypothetical protein